MSLPRFFNWSKNLNRKKIKTFFSRERDLMNATRAQLCLGTKLVEQKKEGGREIPLPPLQNIISFPALFAVYTHSHPLYVSQPLVYLYLSLFVFLWQLFSRAYFYSFLFPFLFIYFVIFYIFSFSFCVWYLSFSHFPFLSCLSLSLSLSLCLSLFLSIPPLSLSLSHTSESERSG